MTDIIPPSPDYAGAKPEPDDPVFFARQNPIALFEEWLTDARAKEPNDPNAMTLATVDASGAPDARMVLLKDVDPRGFTFYSNEGSAKGGELAANANAALVFHWKSLRRQVRVRGAVEAVSAEEADAYFATRARDAQIGAWASEQSRAMEGRFALEKRIAEYALKFGIGKIPRPPFWCGWRVVPVEIEFWRDRPFRLHDRLQFQRAAARAPWTTRRLYP
ncbi:MAG: pyridoxamine 5'-phosphate oxidase [Caulobacterales bacterium]